MKRPHLIAVGALIAGIGASTFGWWKLRTANRALSSRLAEARVAHAETLRSEAENRKLSAVVAMARQDRVAARQALAAEVEAARLEVRELEDSARERFEERAAKTRERLEMLRSNRDLAKGPVLIENCRNVGTGSPADTLQTIVWAAATGHDDVSQALFAYGAATRVAAEAALAALPAEVRAKYPTPESLAALFAASAVNDLSAICITHLQAEDASHVVVKASGITRNLGEIPMQLGPSGWQVTIDAQAFDRISRKLLGASKSK